MKGRLRAGERAWLRPRTLRGRFVLIMLLGVLGAQVTSYSLWSWQQDRERLAQLDSLSRNLAEFGKRRDHAIYVVIVHRGEQRQR